MKHFCLLFIFQIATISSALSQVTIDGIDRPYFINQGEIKYWTAHITDESNLPIIYEWDFGEGEDSKVIRDNPNVSYKYITTGDHTITLNVKYEESSGTAFFEIDAHVINLPPKIMYTDYTPLGEGWYHESERTTADSKNIRIRAIVYETAMDNLTYHIDFGDGNTSDDSQDPWDEDGELLVWHRYAEKGYYTVTITVDDGDGGTDSRSFIVSVDEDWGAKVSGGINDTISGGSAMMYYYNDKRNVCHKLIALYDDANNSILSFNEVSNKGITNRTIPLTFNSPTGMNVRFLYKINAKLYGTTKIMATLWDQTTDRILLSNTLAEDSMANVAPIPSDDYLNGDFEALGGQLVTGPLTGNSFKGEYTITLKERPKNSADVPRLIGIRGTFEINANPRSFEQMQNGCEGVPDDFVVTDHSPLNHEANVHPSFPCLEVEFSEPIDINSADFNTIQLGYYDNMSRFVSVPLGIEAVSETRIKLIPAAPLRNAVIYQAIIKSGESGIRSREGGSLSEDFRWEFETVVEPTDVSVRVYQTIKDRPLINGKQTLVRIVLNWEKPEDVHPNSFVKSFKAYVSLKNSSGRLLCYPTPSAEFKQQDAFTREEIRMAKNSLNIYGWKPSHADGANLIVEVQPNYMDCLPDEEWRTYKITHPITHDEKALELTCDYYFLPIHTWANGGLSDDQMLMADQIMDKVSAFSVQLFPIRKLNTENRGIFPAYGSDFVSYGDPGTDSISVKARNNALLEGVMRDFYLTEAVYSSADIVFVFLPQIDGVCQGFTYTHSLSSFFPRGDRYFRMELTPLLETKAAIEHEIGHTFELKHAPGEWTQIKTIPLAGLEQHPNHNHIEGFRLYDGTNDGDNKSCEEGNAQSGKLVDLMYPYLTVLERKDQFISSLDYDRVTEHFKYYMSSRTVMNQPDFSVFDGGLADLSGDIFRFLDNGSSDKNILIQGEISKDGIAVIQHMSVTEKSLEGISSNKGSYRLVALDSAGSPLFTDNFAPDSVAGDLENTWPMDNKYFTSVIPYDEGIAKFEVVHKNHVLGSYTISDHQPVVEFTNIEKGAKLKSGKNEIQWNASDLDNDPLEFTLSYSPNGIDHWQVIGRTDITSVSFDAEYLSIGDGPTLKIEASDGYNVGTQLLSVEREIKFGIQTYGPVGNENEYKGIFVRFKNPVNEREIITGGHLLLVEKSKAKLVASYVTYDAEINTAQIHPLEKLESGVTYTVGVRKMGLIKDINSKEEKYIVGTIPLADIYGNEPEKDFMWDFVKQ